MYSSINQYLPNLSRIIYFLIPLFSNFTAYCWWIKAAISGTLYHKLYIPSSYQYCFARDLVILTHISVEWLSLEDCLKSNIDAFDVSQKLPRSSSWIELYIIICSIKFHWEIYTFSNKDWSYPLLTSCTCQLLITIVSSSRIYKQWQWHSTLVLGFNLPLSSF